MQPDYVFVSTIYDYSFPISSFDFHDVVQFAKLCHITYGSNLTYIFLNRLLKDYPDFYRNVYFCFCSGETAKIKFTEKFQENVALGYSRFEFLGYPILERYYKMPATKSSAKRILWTPRWNYEGKRGGSHFFEFKDKFPALQQRYGDKVSLSMRPHRLAFSNFVKSGLMTKEELDDYRSRMKKSRIKISNASAGEIDADIRETDIFLADYSSMLIEIFLTGRPIIYCEFPNAEPLPEYTEMFAAMYIAHSWEDVLRYLDDLVAGNDPLFDKRQAVAKKIYEMHKDSTKKIVERILQDFKDSQLD